MTVLFHDDFAEGLRSSGPGAPWAVRPAGSLAAGDGVPRATPGGLVVEPGGTDPASGLPAFVQPPAGEAFDHLRWSAFAPAVPAPSDAPHGPVGGELTVSATLSAELFHTDRRDAPSDTEADTDTELSLGSAALIALDRTAGLILDFALTNTRVWALYGRVPGPDGARGGFSYGIPVAERSPGLFHDCALVVDTDEGRARWVLDGEEVFAVDRLGLALADSVRPDWLIPGPLDVVRPKALAPGLALLADRLFGQGVRLTVRELSVVSVVPATAGTPGEGS